MSDKRGKILLKYKENKSFITKILRCVPFSLAGIVYTIIAGLYINKGGVFVDITIASIVSIFGPPVIAALLPGKYNITIYQSGVVVKGGFISNFTDWKSIKSFDMNAKKKQFQLKLSLGYIRLISREHFDEVKQILEENISSRD